MRRRTRDVAICANTSSYAVPEYSKHIREMIGCAAASCFGVAGVASPRGVRVVKDGDGLSVDVHILVVHGLNIIMIVRSVTAKVCYTVKEAANLNVLMVNVFVDGMISRGE